jgi:hypothetical protein
MALDYRKGVATIGHSPIASLILLQEGTAIAESLSIVWAPIKGGLTEFHFRLWMWACKMKEKTLVCTQR